MVILFARVVSTHDDNVLDFKLQCPDFSVIVSKLATIYSSTTPHRKALPKHHGNAFASPAQFEFLRDLWPYETSFTVSEWGRCLAKCLERPVT